MWVFFFQANPPLRGKELSKNQLLICSFLFREKKNYSMQSHYQYHNLLRQFLSSKFENLRRTLLPCSCSGPCQVCVNVLATHLKTYSVISKPWVTLNQYMIHDEQNINTTVTLFCMSFLKKWDNTSHKPPVLRYRSSSYLLRILEILAMLL